MSDDSIMLSLTEIITVIPFTYFLEDEFAELDKILMVEVAEY